MRAPFGARLAWRALASDEDRRTVAHALLTSLLAPTEPQSVRIIRQCPACGSGAHGAPIARLPGTSTSTGEPAPLISISYTTGLVAVGVAPAGTEAFGIDIELDDGATRARVTAALGARTTLDTWTRLEAVAKARRTGLRDAYADVTFVTHDDGTWRVRPGPADARDPAPLEALHGAGPYGADMHGADLRVAASRGGAPAILSLAYAPGSLGPGPTGDSTGSSGSASA